MLWSVLRPTQPCDAQNAETLRTRLSIPVRPRPAQRFAGVVSALLASIGFTTYEEIERRDLRVIKRDGRHEPFDRQKLLGGMIKACEKRPVGYDALERAVEEIIQELEQAYDHEVPTNAIGIRVMERLHSMDEVAYIRYASVYQAISKILENSSTRSNLWAARSNATPCNRICLYRDSATRFPTASSTRRERALCDSPGLALYLPLSRCRESRLQSLVAGGTRRSERLVLSLANTRK